VCPDHLLFTFFNSDHHPPPIPCRHAVASYLFRCPNLELLLLFSLPSTLSGSLDLELVLATGTGSATHPIAKCYNSMSVTVSDACVLTVTANGEYNFVPSLYSADNAAYSQYDACPTGTTTTVADGATVAADDVAALIATSIYADGLTATGAVGTGTVTITSGTAVLQFRPSAQTGSTVSSVTVCLFIFIFCRTRLYNNDHLQPVSMVPTVLILLLCSLFRFSFLQAGIFAVGAPTCSEADECAATSTACAAGRYPVAIDGQSTYLCAFCAAGEFSLAGAATCTACGSGTAAPAVGATLAATCSACGAGTYATSGSSDCRPCAPGT
jgi:hypothetical protein